MSSHACLQAAIALAGRCRCRPLLALAHLGAGSKAAALDFPSVRSLGLGALGAGGRIRGHGSVLLTTTASSLPTTTTLATSLCATAALGGRHGCGHPAAGSVQCSEHGFKKRSDKMPLWACVQRSGANTAKHVPKTEMSSWRAAPSGLPSRGSDLDWNAAKEAASLVSLDLMLCHMKETDGERILQTNGWGALQLGRAGGRVLRATAGQHRGRAG